MHRLRIQYFDRIDEVFGNLTALLAVFSYLKCDQSVEYMDIHNYDHRVSVWRNQEPPIILTRKVTE